MAALLSILIYANSARQNDSLSFVAYMSFRMWHFLVGMLRQPVEFSSRVYFFHEESQKTEKLEWASQHSTHM